MTSWATFRKTYAPVPRPGLRAKPRDWGDYILDGVPSEEAVLLAAHKERRLWTLVDGEGTAVYLVPGWRAVNRMGFLVAAKPWTDENGEVEL